MAQSILIPVDLAHKDALSKAVSVAGDLAKLGDGAKLTLIGVTSSAVTEAAHNPVEFEKTLRHMRARSLKTSDIQSRHAR